MSLSLNQLKSKRPAASSIVAAPPVLRARLDACTRALFGLGGGLNASPDVVQHCLPASLTS